MHKVTVTTPTMITVASITTALVAQAILTISKVLSVLVGLSEKAVEPEANAAHVEEEAVIISESHSSVQSKDQLRTTLL